MTNRDIIEAAIGILTMIVGFWLAWMIQRGKSPRLQPWVQRLFIFLLAVTLTRACR